MLIEILLYSVINSVEKDTMQIGVEKSDWKHMFYSVVKSQLCVWT